MRLREVLQLAAWRRRWRRRMRRHRDAHRKDDAVVLHDMPVRARRIEAKESRLPEPPLPVVHHEEHGVRLVGAEVTNVQHGRALARVGDAVDEALREAQLRLRQSQPLVVRLGEVESTGTEGEKSSWRAEVCKLLSRGPRSLQRGVRVGG